MVWDYFENFYGVKQENLVEMDKFLDFYCNVKYKINYSVLIMAKLDI